MMQLTIDIPEPLAQFAGLQAVREGYGTISDYLASLLMDKQRRQLNTKLLRGLESPDVVVGDELVKQLAEKLSAKSRDQTGE
jgi:hypothetical protein